MRQIGSELTSNAEEIKLRSPDSGGIDSTKSNRIYFNFISSLSNWGIKQFCWVLNIFNFSFDWLYPLYDDNQYIEFAEADDPLKRIQDEINEVARRERELREKTQRQQQEQFKIQQQQQQQQQEQEQINEQNNKDNTNHSSYINHQLNNHRNNSTTVQLCNNNNSNNNSLNSTLSSNDDGISSINTSISPIITNGTKETTTNLDSEHHSDDSGISASSSPTPINVKKYIRTNNYNVISPTPPAQQIQYNKTLTTKSFNNFNTINNISSNSNSNNTVTQNGNATTTTQRTNLLQFTPIRRVTTGPAHKGLMQRFIATRGKITLNNNNNNNNINGMNGTMTNGYTNGSTNDGGSFSAFNDNQFNHSSNHHRPSVFLPPVNTTQTIVSPPIIERDAEGKPLRPGYIPVEEKIQKELKDIKSRESELRKIRRLKSRQSQPDLLESIENEFGESDEDSEVEHCYPPGKLRAVKSISELCDTINLNSISPSRTTPSPNFERNNRHHTDSLRPAVSLAQLCELDDNEEAPSSHELIAKWESLIQQNS